MVEGTGFRIHLHFEIGRIRSKNPEGRTSQIFKAANHSIFRTLMRINYEYFHKIIKSIRNIILFCFSFSTNFSPYFCWFCAYFSILSNFRISSRCIPQISYPSPSFLFLLISSFSLYSFRFTLFLSYLSSFFPLIFFLSFPL